MAATKPIEMTDDDARILRDLVKALRNINGSGGILVDLQPGIGLTIGLRRAKPGAAGAVSGITQLRVKTEHDDYLTCRTWDGTNEGSEDVLVAKPADLQGNTATRTVSGEDQEIFPAYANATIYAARPLGGTEVTVSTVPLVWMDLNNDARRWVYECEE